MNSAIVVLLTLASSLQGASEPAADPLILAAGEGVVRQQLSACPFTTTEREYALLLSQRFEQSLTIAYRARAEETAVAIELGEKHASEAYAKQALHGCTDASVRQCQLLWLEERDDAAVKDLLGSVDAQKPADWPSRDSVDCSFTEKKRNIEQPAPENSGDATGPGVNSKDSNT